MAKIRGPLFSIDCSGMFAKEVIFISSQEGIYTQDVYPGNVPDTENQWKNQAVVSITNELYSIPDRLDWQAWKNRVGSTPLTGNNLFTSLANKAQHREVSFNIISEVKLTRNSSSPQSSPDTGIITESSESGDSQNILLSEPSADYDSSQSLSFLAEAVSSVSADFSPEPVSLANTRSCETAILTFKTRYDSLILISCWPYGARTLPLEQIVLDPAWQTLPSQQFETDTLSADCTPVLPLPETDSSSQLSPDSQLLLVQARGWDDPDSRRLDWDNWDWDSWNQAKEINQPLKVVTDNSSQAPLNQVQLTGLQPDRQYYCRLTELPRLLPGPPDLTASFIQQNTSTIDNTVTDDLITATDSTKPADDTIIENNNTDNSSHSSDSSVSSNSSDKNISITSNNNSHSGDSIISSNSSSSGTSPLNSTDPESPDAGNTPQNYFSRAKSSLDSAPHSLVYAVTCCLPDLEDASISWIVCEDSPIELSPENYLNLSWQTMPEASYYKIYRTFSTAGLPCGYLGCTTSSSYQDRGQVIQKFIQPPAVKPHPLITGDSGFYLF